MVQGKLSHNKQTTSRKLHKISYKSHKPEIYVLLQSHDKKKIVFHLKDILVRDIYACESGSVSRKNPSYIISDNGNKVGILRQRPTFSTFVFFK